MIGSLGRDQSSIHFLVPPNKKNIPKLHDDKNELTDKLGFLWYVGYINVWWFYDGSESKLVDWFQLTVSLGYFGGGTLQETNKKNHFGKFGKSSTQCRAEGGTLLKFNIAAGSPLKNRPFTALKGYMNHLLSIYFQVRFACFREGKFGC